MHERRVVVMGAAGRDFHDFLVRFKSDARVRVVAFTAAQIPGIDSRTFPAALAGDRYPNGIPIRPEYELSDLIAREQVDEVVFAYSDVSHEDVMHHAEMVIAAGADFTLLGAEPTMLVSRLPVISVCGVRTGVGKSSVTRRVFSVLRTLGLRAVVLRHPMPYRDLAAMRAERYASIEDLDRLGCTIEEREEHEPLIEEGAVVMAGIDYEAILRAAETEADVVIWDGGNNDLPFIRPDLEIVVLDPHRVGHERLYHPGEANFLRADVLVVNKVDSANPDSVRALRETAKTVNADARLVLMNSLIAMEGDPDLTGRHVLAVEDGPTVTHGGMPYGAGALAALRAGGTLVDPRPFAVGSIASTFAAFPHLTNVLPAMGYSPAQLADLGATVRAADADVVVVATPIDLARLVDLGKPSVRVRYAVSEQPGSLRLADLVAEFCARVAPNTG